MKRLTSYRGPEEDYTLNDGAIEGFFRTAQSEVHDAAPARHSRPARQDAPDQNDALRYVLAKLEARPRYQTWKHAAELLIITGATPEVITRQIEFALLMDGQLNDRFASEQQLATGK